MSYFSKGAAACLMSASMLVGAGTASVSLAATPPTVQVVHSFAGNIGTSDGYAPFGTLFEDGAGQFYGTTFLGGTGPCIGGCGTVFKVNADGTEMVLYSFTAGTDGALPAAGLIKGRDGNLYGTTRSGGGGAGCQSDAFVANWGLTGCGTVFSISPAGAVKIVYAFTGVNGDGAVLRSGLVQDARGNLFGVTQDGGDNDAGTVFEITPDAKERVLYSFSGGLDGSQPNGVTIGRDGALYGTTLAGGASGVGTVFRVERDGTEEVLHSFSGEGGDGAYPGSGLLLAHNGSFYGSTLSGGSLGSGCLFRITRAGDLSIVYSFAAGVADSVGPNGPLVQDAEGDIYGTTESGGSAGLGSVFKLSQRNVFTTLLSLGGPPADAADPASGLILGRNGNLYGTSTSGGTYDGGTVFEIAIASKHHAHDSDDRDPRGERRDSEHGERTSWTDSD